MIVERLIRIFAGAFVLVSLALGVEASPLFHSKHWLWLTAFVGANLFQSGFTGICPPTFILRRLGFRSTAEAELARGGKLGGQH
jgi:hypothetical protein